MDNNNTIALYFIKYIQRILTLFCDKLLISENKYSLLDFRHLGQELAETINSMCNNASNYLNKARPPIPGTMAGLGPKQTPYQPQSMVNPVGKRILCLFHEM